MGDPKTISVEVSEAVKLLEQVKIRKMQDGFMIGETVSREKILARASGSLMRYFRLIGAIQVKLLSIIVSKNWTRRATPSGTYMSTPIPPLLNADLLAKHNLFRLPQSESQSTN